eukprot:4392078-Pleurochrysis_carterae.AAC.1
MPESPSLRSFASSSASRRSVWICRTYAVRLGWVAVKPVLPKSVCFLSWSRRSSTPMSFRSE